MTSDIEQLINSAVLKIINDASTKNKLDRLKNKHDAKIHFIPKRYRVFGGLLQSMNIQFGNFIEELMMVLIANEAKYEIISEYSGKKAMLLNYPNQTKHALTRIYQTANMGMLMLTQNSLYFCKK